MHPEAATRSCNDCRKWVYKSDGSLHLRPAVGGKPIPRPPNTPTPCNTCPKIPANAPAKDSSYAVELSTKNLAAYWHYQQCKAVGVFPDDPIVRRNAAVIAGVIKRIDDMRFDRVFLLLGGRL